MRSLHYSHTAKHVAAHQQPTLRSSQLLNPLCVHLLFQVRVLGSWRPQCWSLVQDCEHNVPDLGWAVEGRGL
jgi:hypothetical protein